MIIKSSVILSIGLSTLLACATGCKERKQKNANTPVAPVAKVSPKRGQEDQTGEEVMRAAKDPLLPAEIREGATVFKQILQNEPISRQDFNLADWKLHSRRTEATCKIWISLLLATEARIPNPLPSKQDMIAFEKRILEKKLEVFDVENMKFTALLHPCVKALTQYDMPEADLQVDEFMKRFESNYGASEVGHQILEGLKIEISQAKDARKMGRVPWKWRLAEEAAEGK